MQLYIGEKPVNFFFVLELLLFYLMLFWGSLLSWLFSVLFHCCVPMALYTEGWAIVHLVMLINETESFFKYKVMAITTVLKQVKLSKTINSFKIIFSQTINVLKKISSRGGGSGRGRVQILNGLPYMYHT